MKWATEKMRFATGVPRYIRGKYVPEGFMTKDGKIQACVGLERYCAVCVFKKWCTVKDVK